MEYISIITGMPTFALAIIAVFIVGIVFAILRRLIKFAITLAALTILLLVIVRLLDH
ncbi:MAG: hypothetical protein ACK5C0_12115 [Candidatus Kapaibacterium sp.]|jgi:hypothetical protein|nr:hypothetical protein [Candidatus Kapabacteria bacterium]